MPEVGVGEEKGEVGGRGMKGLERRGNGKRMKETQVYSDLFKVWRQGTIYRRSFVGMIVLYEEHIGMHEMWS